MQPKKSVSEARSGLSSGGWALLLSVLPGLVGAGLFAQTAGEVVVVVEVEVPVHVLVNGKPVRGLRQEDFILRAAGRKREIIGFREVDLQALDRDEAGTALPLSARRHFLLLFDLAFAAPVNIARAQDAALGVLADDFLPSDLVSVGTLSTSRGLRILLGFTPDHEQVRQAVVRLRVASLREAAADPLGLTLGSGIGDPFAPGSLAARGAESVDLTTLEEQVEEAQLIAGYDMLIRSLNQLAELLRPIDGAKHVIYLSAGASSRILFGAGVQSEAERQQIVDDNEAAMLGLSYSATLAGRFGDTSTLVNFEKTLKELVRSGSSIQAIDIGGLRAEAAGLSSGDDTLFFMADTTGGHHIRNHNDLGAAMNKILERTSVSYILSFQAPPGRRSGKYEKISVRLSKRIKGARIHHRPGYHSPVPYAELSLEARRAQAARWLLAEQRYDDLDVAVRAERTTDPGSWSSYAITVKVGAASVRAASLPTGANEIEIYVYVFAAGGRIVAFFDKLLPPPTETDGELRTNVNLLLESGTYEVRTLVREAGSGATSTRVLKLEVP